MGQSKPLPMPRGLHTVTPTLTLRDCAKAIAFYQRAFGAKQKLLMKSPDGRAIWHAELEIGDSTIFCNDEMPGAPVRAPSPDQPAAFSIQLYVEDCDATFKRACDAGAKSTMKPDDMFWGDRVASVVDPWGYSWSLSTHVRDVSEAEMRRAMEAIGKKMAAGADPRESGTWRVAEDEERDSMR
jgi:uncharacterized glyoxalase superfamily protein PhnB